MAARRGGDLTARFGPFPDPARWRLGVERVRWPVLAFQLAVFSSMFGLNPTGGYGGDGSFFRQLGWVLMFALAVLGVTATPSHFRAVLREVSAWRWPIMGVVAFWAFAMASSLWAEFPAVSAKRAALLGIVIVVTVAASASIAVLRLTLSDVLLPPLLALLVISVLFTAAFPGVGFTPIGWQGMTGHKNIAGQLAAILFLCSLLVTGQRWYCHPAVRVGIALSTLAALGMSRSATSMVALTAATGLVALVLGARVLRRHPTWAVPALFFALMVVASIWILVIFDLLPSGRDLSSVGLSALGKSDTLTGRTRLWEFVLAQEPYRNDLLGLGYGGFWDPSIERMLYVIANLGFRPIQAHNGYLDLFNEVGFVGLCLALATAATVAVRALGQLVGTAGATPAVAASAFVVFVLVANLSESSLFRTTNFLNLLFLGAAMTSLPRPLEQAQARGPAERC